MVTPSGNMPGPRRPPLSDATPEDTMTHGTNTTNETNQVSPPSAAPNDMTNAVPATNSDPNATPPTPEPAPAQQTH